MSKPVLQRHAPFDKKECVRCDDKEFRIDGFCSVYCRDMDELEQTIKKVWAVLVRRKGDVIKRYMPELGQMCFGQPWKEYEAPNILISALSMINDELFRIMWNIHQKEYATPFSNTGAQFKELDVFQVEAYSWDDEHEQPWNFRWNDVEISWYKHMWRGTTVNKKLSAKRIATMLDECLSALDEYDRSHCSFCSNGLGKVSERHEAVCDKCKHD